MSKEPVSLKDAWAKVIAGEDYDGFMAEIGQAQANAGIVAEFIEHVRPEKGARVVVAGAGTGQMFDHHPLARLPDHEVLFTDINPQFLARLEPRARQAGLVNFSILVDDLEQTQIPAGPDAIIVVLVLEHIQWERALRNLAALSPGALMIVIQKNPTDVATNVSPHRVLPASMQRGMDDEKPHLLEAESLIATCGELGYAPVWRDERSVPDGKFMCGFVFRPLVNS